MTLAALAGLGTGALHAVSGPDHVLSLAPQSARLGGRAWQLGLRWGLGHGIGTLLIAVLALLVLGDADTALVTRWSDRLAGAALIVTGVLAVRGGRGDAAPADRAALMVGFVHGLAGGAAVVALVPALVPPTWAHVMVYTTAFALGSTVAMAALTRAIASLGGTVAAARVARLARGVGAASIALGSAWVYAG